MKNPYDEQSASFFIHEGIMEYDDARWEPIAIDFPKSAEKVRDDYLIAAKENFGKNDNLAMDFAVAADEIGRFIGIG